MSAFQTIPFRAEHARAVRLQPSQAHLVSVVREAGYVEMLAERSIVAVSVASNGRIIACGGVMEIWHGRGFCWALVAKSLPSEFIAVHRAARRMLDTCGIERVEAYIDEGFEQGQRWMDLLGFEQETPVPMERFANGRACYLYARVNE